MSDRTIHRLSLLLALAGALTMIAWQAAELRTMWGGSFGEFTAPRPELDYWPHRADPTRRS